MNKLLVVLFTMFAGCYSFGENELYQRLIQNYRSNERPTRNFFDPIDVKVDLALKQIINMDEKKQVLIWNGWVRQHWKDINLSWNVSKERGIQTLAMNKEDIWTPDLAVYTNAKEGFQLISDHSEEKVVVDSIGNCLWMTSLVFRTTCKLDITYFPFDEQRCIFEVGSWAYTGDRLNISYKHHQKDIASEAKTYIVNGVWDIHDISAVLKIGYYACCVEPYPSVIYTLTLRRRSLFYLLNFFVPSCWIALLASVSFCLPQTSGERVTLLITNLLSLAFFIMILSNTIPANSEVTPLLELYLTAVFIEICLALVARSFIDKTKRRHERPGIITSKLVNKYLATLLGVKRPSDGQARSQVRSVAASGVELESIHVSCSPGIQSKTARNNDKDKADVKRKQRRIAAEEDEPHKGAYSDATTGILSSLHVISESVEETSKSEAKQRELNYFVLNLDEFFFWFFTATLCLTLLLLFLAPPHITMQ